MRCFIYSLLCHYQIDKGTL